MTYNRFLYNTALYNAGREEVGAIARSIIQAHTGPHIQAVVGSTSGVSFISDFIIQEGAVRKPPTSFRFPDLTAFIRAVRRGQKDVSAYIKGQAFLDLPGWIFPSDRIPDLPAIIFGLLEANLLATIVGKLGEHDLSAIIQVGVAHLAGRISGMYAPNLPAHIFVQPPADLGARIHAPLDLPAYIIPVQESDLPGILQAIQYGDVGGYMLGVPTPQLFARIKGFAADIADLPARTLPLTFVDQLSALITASIPGPQDITGTIGGTGGYHTIPTAIRSLVESTGDLGALIKTGGEWDLTAIIDMLGVGNLGALVGTIPEGEKDKLLNAFLQPLNLANLAAALTTNQNVAFLGAAIESLRDAADLGGFLRVAETFITTILTISTMASRDLRATVGSPNCVGGSASVLLSAIAAAQHKGDVGAFIQSFAESDLRATVNSLTTFHAFDTINVLFSPYAVRTPLPFKATDTIEVRFSPFRGLNLGATITSLPNNVDLAASLNVVFPLPRVVPAVHVLTAADLRVDREQDIQEVRLQLEGTLLEYLYVNGTEQALIRDPTTGDWQINVRSFRPIAEGLFGDHAANKICRLGSLESYNTMDAAVRSCIQAVLGFEEEQDLAASISAAGGIESLPARLTVQKYYGDLTAFAGRVFPSDVEASIDSSGGYQSLAGAVYPTTSTTYGLGASIAQESQLNLAGTVAAISGTDVGQLGAAIDITEISNLGGAIALEQNTQSWLTNGSSYMAMDTLANLGFAINDRQFSVVFWTKWNTAAVATPSANTTILGAASDLNWNDGFGFYWEDSDTISFFVNAKDTNEVSSGNLADVSQWTHVVGTYDADLAAGNIKIYINGSLVASGTHTADLTGTSNVLEIGRISSVTPSTYFPDQYFDEIGVWSGVVLSGSEVSDLYNIPVRNLMVNRETYNHADDLVLYYQFEDTTSSFPTVTNVTNSGTFDGTLVNANISDIVADVPT